MSTASVPQVPFGWYLTKARKEAEMKQAEAALAIGVSKAGLGKWERSQAYPNVKHMRRLVEVYGAPWLWDAASDQERCEIAYLTAIPDHERFAKSLLAS